MGQTVDVTITAKDATGAALDAATRRMALLEIEARKMNATMDAEKATKFGKAIDGLKAPFSGLQGMLEKVKAHWGMLLGVVAGGALFGEAISSTVEWTGSVVQLSKRLGITTEDASGLNVALHHVGLSVDDYATVATKMTKQLRTNEDAFKSLGIRTKESNGEWRNTQGVLGDAVDKLNSMKAGTDRNIAAQALFGARAGNLTQILRLSSEMLAESAEKARKYHLVVGPEGAKQMRSYKDAMADLKLVGESLSVQVGNALLPVMLSLGSFLGSQGPGLAGAFGTALKGIATAALFAWGGINALAQSAHFLNVLMSTPLGKGYATTVGKAWREMGDNIQQTNDRADNAILKLRGFGNGRTSKGPGGDTLGGDDLKGGKEARQTYIESLQKEINLLEKAAKLGVLRVDSLKRLWALQQQMTEAAKASSGLSLSDRVTAAIAAKTLGDVDPLGKLPGIEQTGTGKAGPMSLVMPGNLAVNRGPLSQSVAADDSAGNNIAKGFHKATDAIDETRASIASLSYDIGDTLRSSVDGLSEAWGQAFEEMAAGSGALSTVMLREGRRAIAGIVSAKGSETLLDASKAFAEGFHDPSQFLVAAKLFAVGTGYKALAGVLGGSGGGSAGGGGGGGLSSGGFSQSASATQALGKITVQWPGKTKSILDVTDPDDQDAVKAMLQKLAGNREIEFIFSQT